MSITAAQRAALNFQSRPPGSPSMWYAIGTSLRALGKSIDAFGVGLQGECATVDKRASASVVARTLFPAGPWCSDPTLGCSH